MPACSSSHKVEKPELLDSVSVQVNPSICESVLQSWKTGLNNRNPSLMLWSRTGRCLTVPSHLSNLGSHWHKQLTWSLPASPLKGRTWLWEAVTPCHWAQFLTGEPRELSDASTGLMPKVVSNLGAKQACFVSEGVSNQCILVKSSHSACWVF